MQVGGGGGVGGLQIWEILDCGPLLILSKLCPPLGVTFIICEMGPGVGGQTEGPGHTDITGSREENCLHSL